jgi:hypothetical protein
MSPLVFYGSHPSIIAFLLKTRCREHLSRTTESHYCRKREDTAIREVLEIFDTEKSRVVEKPLIEN